MQILSRVDQKLLWIIILAFSLGYGTATNFLSQPIQQSEKFGADAVAIARKTIFSHTDSAPSRDKLTSTASSVSKSHDEPKPAPTTTAAQPTKPAASSAGKVATAPIPPPVLIGTGTSRPAGYNEDQGQSGSAERLSSQSNSLGSSDHGSDAQIADQATMIAPYGQPMDSAKKSKDQKAGLPVASGDSLGSQRSVAQADTWDQTYTRSLRKVADAQNLAITFIEEIAEKNLDQNTLIIQGGEIVDHINPAEASCTITFKASNLKPSDKAQLLAANHAIAIFYKNKGAGTLDLADNTLDQANLVFSFRKPVQNGASPDFTFGDLDLILRNKAVANGK